MVRMRLLGGLGFLFVVVLTIGSLLGMATSLVGDVASMLVVGLVLVVFLSLAGHGSGFDDGTTYW